ncbi:MAG: hypothetical protein H0W81_03310 [Chloroflexi bacterium]|nr:hypothetical protein [Chloroflexota bacterium]
MKNKPDIQHVLDRWFEEGPTVVPDRVLDTALEMIDGTKQRRVWGVSWRYSTMSNFAKIAAAAVLILAVGLVAFVVVDITRGPPIGAPSDSPNPSQPGVVSPSAQPTESPPRAAAWSATGSLATTREYHTSTLLEDGKVLVVGGNAYIGLLASAELYDPLTGRWNVTGSLTTAREHQTATLLADGKVLVAGGYSQPAALSSAELYDPSTGTWSVTGSMTTARRWGTATLLADGKVLVAGGNDASVSGQGTTLASAELYDPATGTWSPTGSMATARESQTATLLNDGNVLVAGGVRFGASDSDIGEFQASAELYDPATGTWSVTGSMTTERTSPTATLLAGGDVLVAGGGARSDPSLKSAELYDPRSGTWKATGSMSAGRQAYVATLLPDGRVLATGGTAANGIDGSASAELYDPSTGIWTATASLIAGRQSHTATLLADGTVLVVGGQRGSPNDALASAELYDPGTGT